jgi:hypothetical protein
VGVTIPRYVRRFVGVVVLIAAGVAVVASSAVSAPTFPARSCWVRLPNPGYAPVRPAPGAPGVLAPAPKHPVDPAALLQATLQRFGDHTLIRSARLGGIPTVVREHRRGWFGPAPQPAHPLWVYVDAPPLHLDGHPSPPTVVQTTREQWELALLAGALHDEACEARTDPVVGASIASSALPEGQVFMSGGPFGQHFPNLPERTLRRRAADAAKAFHARLESMWFLHPLQQAPVIIFEASNKLAFIQSFAKMEQQLGLRDLSTQRYEGYFIEAVDDKHVPFMFVWGVARGELGGGQWSSDGCHYPFVTLGPIGGKSGCNG